MVFTKRPEQAIFSQILGQRTSQRDSFDLVVYKNHRAL